ncbi:GDSL-type esterase/lipase family protein [Chryseolinea sp. T2]|uniref:GDSL-type esterase/lipase family protein n=1 Tax=Chryseolinea sp. T2 TaxID=3129255 RepID=UPI003077D8A1
MRLNLHAAITALAFSFLQIANTYGQASTNVQQVKGPERFRNEVTEISGKPAADTSRIVLFTGSSSIRLWHDIKAYFPSYNIINRGFGGSQTSDLLYFADQLIFTLRPSKIFIYEGDNDLAGGKSSAQIMATTDSLLHRIRKQYSASVPVYFISPKPSVARWKLKDAYLDHSRNLRKWVGTKKNVYYVDGWSSLVDNNGEVLKDIFKEDNLHLNKKGYDLWATGIKKFLP